MSAQRCPNRPALVDEPAPGPTANRQRGRCIGLGVAGFNPAERRTWLAIIVATTCGFVESVDSRPTGSARRSAAQYGLSPAPLWPTWSTAKRDAVIYDEEVHRFVDRPRADRQARHHAAWGCYRPPEKHYKHRLGTVTSTSPRPSATGPRAAYSVTFGNHHR